MYSEDHMHDLYLINVVGNITNEDKTKYMSKLLSKNHNSH